MYTRRSLVLGLLAAGLLLAQDAPQTIQVTGTVKQALTLTADDLGKMPRASVRIIRSIRMLTKLEVVQVRQ